MDFTVTNSSLRDWHARDDLADYLRSIGEDPSIVRAVHFKSGAEFDLTVLLLNRDGRIYPDPQDDKEAATALRHVAAPIFAVPDELYERLRSQAA